MVQIVWLMIGLVAAALFLFYARRRGTRREPVILALGLLIAALIYVGFAIVWGDARWLAIEVGGLLLYSLFVWLALRDNTGWLAVGWVAHPVWDIGLHWLGEGHTVAPEWYVFACLAFDLLVAGYIVTRMNEWDQGLSRTHFGRM